MAHGVKVYADAGDLVIDDDYEAYAFLGTYSMTFVGNSTNPYNTSSNLYPVYHNYRCDIVSTTRPLVFYQPPPAEIPYSYPSGAVYPMFDDNQLPGVALVAIQNIGGNTWRCYFVAPWVGLAGYTTVKAFVSTKSLGVSTNPVGVRTRNSAGDLTFDSGWRILNPRPYISTLTRMQNNVSNVLSAQITFNPTNDLIAGPFNVLTWISAFTREPTISTVIDTNTPLAYTYIFKVFSQNYSNSTGNYYGLYSWPAVCNVPSWSSYNAILGSNQNTQIGYLAISGADMATYFS